MKTIGFIPARFSSTRFPGKPLVPLLGKPMVVWVAELTAQALGRENVVVATDSERIVRAVEEAGFRSLMTSEDALTGTDRLWEASRQVDADIYINVQGDEPTLAPEDIRTVAECKRKNMDSVINGMCIVGENEEPANVNLPKVVTSLDGRLLYMSRLPVPGSKSPDKRPKTYYKQVCIYAFTKAELKAFGEHGRKGLAESYEDIEILRFLELGIPVHMVETSGQSLAVDVPEDVEAVEEALRRIHI